MADAPALIFISYAHADTPFVDRLEADLCQHGFAGWVDRHGLAGGQQWRRELQEAIDQAQVVLVVLSPEGVSSKYVQNEYGYADEEGKLIIPLFYRPCKIPLELRGIQWVDFQHSYEQGLAALLDALHRHQQRTTAPSSSASIGSAPMQPPPLEEHIAVKAEPLWKMPSTFTSFIGREQDVTEIAGMLSQSDVRLLTLLGPGGIGKTRLSIAVATSLRPSFDGGICFVALAAISDPELVLPTIAQEMGLKESGAGSLLEQLQSFVGEQPFLLVLDNFEQIVAAAQEIEKLLGGCPHLKVLVTSRAVLHLSAEQLVPIAPLALPPLSQDVSIERMAQSAAVTLFVQRARSILPNFQLTAANAQAIGEVCARLDGLPLAIELAAARMKLLPPQALLSRLSQRLPVLTGGPRSLPTRQQTLRNTIQWSYDLLGPEEQALFRLLAIFMGGWTFEAAEELCLRTDKANLDVLNTLSALLDNSLIQASEQEAEEPRFQMLQTVREYGLEMLVATGEREATQAAYVDYFLALAEQAQPELQGPNQAGWVARLEQEHDNLRVALEWALEEVAGEEVAQRRDIAFRLSAALWPFWSMHGHYSEARTFLERALTRSEEVSVSLRVKVLQAAANVSLQQGDYARAEVLAEQSLTLNRELGNTRGIADSRGLQGTVAWRRGKMTEATTLAEERVRLIRQVGEPGEVADALFSLADVVGRHGEIARGETLFQEALLLYRKAGNDLGVATTLIRSAIARWWFSLADTATIRHRLQEAQTIFTKLGSRHWMGLCSWLAALLALSEGETAKADRLAQESFAMFREIGNPWQIAWGLHSRGRVEAQRGEMTAARSFYQQSLVLTLELSDKFLTPFNLDRLASVMAIQGELREAVQLWGAAEVLREETGVPPPPVDRATHEQAVGSARAQLGEEAFASAWQEGRAMPLQQVIDDTLKMRDDAGK